MSKNSLGGRPTAPSRRKTGEAEKEVLRFLGNVGQPTKWGDIDIKGMTPKMTPKVLSSALKHLRARGDVGMVILNDENGRPLIHYFVIEELPFGEISEQCHSIVETARTYLKKRGLSKKQKAAFFEDHFNWVISTHAIAYMGSLRAALKSSDDEVTKQKFETFFSTLIADPANTALFLCLEDRTTANEVLGKLLRMIEKHERAKMQTIRAELKRRKEKGGGER